MNNYRADVDGLRAIAVGTVVLFHAGIETFSGGYVGVDVFFVISGFLITKIILLDIKANEFTIKNFYDRRIRRIFPLLFSMMLACMLASSWLLLPTDFYNLGLSVIATTLFASNIYFWLKSGYFDAPAELNPLLHTWSLAVEEQFYIFHPLALAALHRFFAPRRISHVVISVLVLSLVFSLWSVGTYPTTAFYLVLSRAWELLVGAVLALGVVPAIRDPRLREASAIAGLLLIGWSALSFSATTPFPGAAALPPCIGAALIIHAGTSGETVVGRLLALRPVVFVGLISYSLYLWHWPVLVLLKHYLSVTRLPPSATLVALATATVLATLSWRFIEQPFRDRRRIARRLVFAAGGGAMALASVLGVLVVAGDGLPVRFDREIVELEAAVKDVSPRREECLARTPDAARRGRLCVMGASGGDVPPSFILWGDSHAAAFMPAIGKVAARGGQAGLLAANAACAPLIGVTRPGRGSDYRCPTFNDAVLAVVRANTSLKRVILAARWGLSAEGYRYKEESGEAEFINDARSTTIGPAENRAVFVRGLRRLLAALRDAGKQVIIIGPVPEIGWDVPKWLAMRRLAMQRGVETQEDIAPTYGEFLARQGFVIRTLNALATEYGAKLIFPHEVLCTHDACRIESLRRPLYIDDDHLSRSGALSIQHIFKPAFQ